MLFFAHSLPSRICRVFVLAGLFFPLALSAQTTILGVSIPANNIAVIAGTGANGHTGDGNPAISSTVKLDIPFSPAVDAAGNLYIGETGYVREVNTQGVISTVVGGGSTATSAAPSGGPAASYNVGGIYQVAFDSAGKLYLAAQGTGLIEKYDPQTQTLTTVAGTFQGNQNSTGDGGPATSAQLGFVEGVAVDAAGNIYTADNRDHNIRIIYEGGTIPDALKNVTTTPVSGNIYTIAGVSGGSTACTPAAHPCGDGGKANLALLDAPTNLAVDADGNLYIADTTDHAIRVIYQGGTATACLIEMENPIAFGVSGGSCANPTSQPVPGYIYTIAGTLGTSCAAAPCNDAGLATSATLFLPFGVLVDKAGNVFIGDSSDAAVREVNVQTGVINVIAGTIKSSGTVTATGLATASKMRSPHGLAFDSAGNLYIVDETGFEAYAIPGVGVESVPQTITFGPLPDVTYGVAPITLSATSNSSSGIAITYSLSPTSPATISGNTLTITGAGTVDVTASQAGNATYTAATPVTQSFAVSKAIVTVAGIMLSQPQGEALPSTLYTISGLVGSDSVTGTPTLQTSYSATTSSVGDKDTIFVSANTGANGLAVSPAADAGNYTFSYVNGLITVVGGLSQTIDFPAITAPLAYGGPAVMLNATTTGIGVPVTYTSTGSVTVTGNATSGWTLTATSAGQGTVTANAAGTTQYAAATPVTQVVSAAQATITVAAPTLTLPYGSTLPSLQATITGLIGSDSLGGTPALSTAYQATDPVNTVDQIAVTKGTLAVQAPALPGNYKFVFNAGTVTVTSGANVINFPAISVANQRYGSSVTLGATASSGLPVSYSVTGNATISNGNLLITGLGPISVTATQPGDSNHVAAMQVVQSFNAQQAILYVTAQPATRPQGAVNPAFTATITGFVNGDANTPLVLTGTPIITTTATPASPPGTYPITPALNTLFSNNYTFSFVPGVLTVTNAPSYTITASPNALTIPIGQSAQTTLTVASLNAYQGSITLSCGQVPIGITCNFSPATVTVVNPPNGIGGTANNISTLTISTTGATAQLRNSTNIVTAGFLLFPGGMAGLLLAFRRKKLVQNARFRQLLVWIVLLSSVAGLGACGSSNGNGMAPIGNTTLLITATGTGLPNSGSQNGTNILYLTVNVVPLP